MNQKSLFKLGKYSHEWVKDFYTQTGIWWGLESEIPEEDLKRAAAIERLCGPGKKRVLELGAGAGNTAAATAAAGHAVLAVEISPNIRNIEALKATHPVGCLEWIEADFYSVQLEGRFDVICYWDGFGVGSDRDHRRLLKRIAGEWLAEGGSVLMDVFCPFKPAKEAGTIERLAPLAGVPGSVEMFRKCHFDPVHCRWTDEWEPTEHPENALAQTVRCYSPVDFLLLLEGTGLALTRIEVSKQEVEIPSGRILPAGPLLEAWSYLAVLQAAG